MQAQIDKEKMQGYRDAIDDLGSRLSCPVCYAIRYMQTTESAVGYQAGWRLAMVEIKHDWEHTCKEFTDAICDQLQRERDACADAMEQEHIRCLALEAALRLVVTHENVDVAKLALNPQMACRRCGSAPECGVAFDRYNLNTVAGIDCLAAK